MTKTFLHLQEADKLIVFLLNQLKSIKYKCNEKRSTIADVKPLLVLLSDEQRLAKKKINQYASRTFARNNGLTEERRTALQSFRRGIKQGELFGDWSTRQVEIFRKQMKTPFRVFQRSVDKVVDHMPKAVPNGNKGKEAQYFLRCKDLCANLESIMSDIHRGVDYVEAFVEPRLNQTTQSSIFQRCIMLKHSDGSRAFHGINMGDKRLLVCGHALLDESKQGEYPNGEKEQISSEDRICKMKASTNDDFCMYKATREMPRLKISNGEAYAMIVERNGIYYTLPLRNPKNVQRALIEGKYVHGRFIISDTSSVAGDSGAPIIDIYGDLVGQHFATGLSVRLNQSNF